MLGLQAYESSSEDEATKPTPEPEQKVRVIPRILCYFKTDVLQGTLKCT